MNDNVESQESNKRKKRIAAKRKSDSITKTLNNNDKNKIISNENKRSLRSSKLMKYDDEPSKTRKRVLESDPTKLKVDDAEEKTSICTSYPSENDG